MAASAACSNPHVFPHTLRFSARGFLALTQNAWFFEVPLIDRWSHSVPVISDDVFGDQIRSRDNRQDNDRSEENAETQRDRHGNNKARL